MIDTNTQAMLLRDAMLCGDDTEQNVGQRAQIDGALANVHTCCPGIIDSFDPATLTAQVQPAVRKLYFPDGEDGIWMDLPLLVDVPVVVLGGGGFALTFPIRSGDECLLLFAERSVDNWHETGNVSEQAHAGMHSLHDAFALVGVRSKAHLITGYNNEGVELRSEDGQTVVRLDLDGELHLKQGDNSFDMTLAGVEIAGSTIRLSGQVILDHKMIGTGGADFTGDVTANGVSLQTHVHSGVATGGGTSGPPL